MSGAYVIGREIGDLGEVIRARKPKRLPVVMTRDEVKAVLANLSGDKWLMASLMYGAGLRLMECLRLRVQDIDFSRIAQGPFASPSEAGKGNSRKGLGRWMGPCIDAQRPGPQVFQRPKGMAMAMGISAGEPQEEHQDRRRGAASHS